MKRWVSFCISVFLVFSCFSMNVFAENDSPEMTDDVVETTNNSVIQTNQKMVDDQLEAANSDKPTESKTGESSENNLN